MKQFVQLKCLPFFAAGEIVKGFGRGSKQLGIPTANLAHNVVEGLPNEVGTGVYYGWASVDNGEVHKMVMSIGWNPFFANKTKSMECHIIHNFDQDLYGSWLKVCILGFLRPEMNFSSLDDLIVAINNDISNAKEALDAQVSLKFKDDEFFSNAIVHDNKTPNGTTATAAGTSE